LKPVVWPQQLTIHTGCSKVGTTSFTMDYVVTDEAGQPVAKGTSVQVMYDYQRATKIPVPSTVRNAIAQLHPV
jgi:acyl-CoA thioesterase FadM